MHRSVIEAETTLLSITSIGPSPRSIRASAFISPLNTNVRHFTLSIDRRVDAHALTFVFDPNLRQLPFLRIASAAPVIKALP
jgi:hypothetical protein